MRKEITIFTTVLAFSFILTSCGCDSDGTAGNWIILLLVMLAWLKGGGS